jgi:hypothetical protein
MALLLAGWTFPNYTAIPIDANIAGGLKCCDLATALKNEVRRLKQAVFRNGD